MREELEERLFNDFPLLYRNQTSSKSCCNLIECGDGWYDILRRASLELEQSIAEMLPQMKKELDIKCSICGCSKHDHYFNVNRKGEIYFGRCKNMHHVPYHVFLPYFLLSKRQVKIALTDWSYFKLLFWKQTIVNRFWRHKVIKKTNKVLQWAHKKFGIGYNKPCYCSGFDYPLPKVVQIKEKLGGLRIYISRGNEKMFQTIRQAEEASLVTCEDCGKPGRERGTGWIRTLCDKCEQEYRRRN
jgi:hypothetical protein